MLERFKKDILVEEFICERIRKNRNNKTLIQDFACDRNPNLMWYLRRDAWWEDNHNHRAVYLVKEKHKIVMYFSLQCGILVQCHKKQLGGVVNKGTESEPSFHIDTDKIEVTKSLPAIEIAHFCVNDAYRKKKKSWYINHHGKNYHVGVYCFYKFIAPLIIDMAEVSGLRYIYLFCADDGSEGLKEHYRTKLGFNIMDDMACIRSKFDRNCECMTIKVEELSIMLTEFNNG